MTQRACAKIVRCAVAASVVLVIAWAIGFILTDRFVWSQYLWWIPWWIYAALALPGALLRHGAGGRWIRRAALAAVVLIVAIGIIRDVGWRGAARGDGVTIVHWNASWPDARDAAGPSARLLALGSDVVVISNPFRFFGDGRDDEWRQQGYDVIVVGVFAIASRIPVLEARQLFATAETCASSFELDTRARFGRTLHVLALDLPSSPWRGRINVAHRFAAHLAETESSSPDVVVGDFNITRGSASIDVIAPGMRDAWLDAGTGWGASWPRERPILHLDHILLTPSLRALRYELVDVGYGVHRAQRCSVVPQSNP